ncbi:MAG: PLP-dependent aminotransferase family protein [Acidimicrobiales bacterium]
MQKATQQVPDQTSSRQLLVDLRGVARGQWGAELERSVRSAIRAGRLRPGARLPSTRALAGDLGVSRSVVVQAFDQLAAEGYLTTRPGAVARVSDIGAVRPAPGGRPARVVHPAEAPSVTRPDVDLRPGSPNLGSLPRAEWGRAVRKALATLTDAELGYGDSRGLPGLREAIADYLGRVRGAVVDPDDLVVVNGFAQGLVVVARMLDELGIAAVGVEDPGSVHTSTHLADQAITVVPVPVDDQGVDIDAARRRASRPLRAVMVTPAHQFPTGAVLSPARRLGLVEWAERADGVVIEDDYDSEYRYDHHAVGTLQGMAPDRVVLGGSVSKTLAPGLRLGWLAVPAALSADAGRHKRSIDLMTPVLEQAALEQLIRSGGYERHIRRCRVGYRRRRDVVVELLADELPEAEVLGTSAGLHLLVTIPSAADETVIEQEAARRGVQVCGLGRYRRSSDSPGRYGSSRPSGFVLGYGHLTEDQLRRGLRGFAAAVRATPGSRTLAYGGRIDLRVGRSSDRHQGG